MATTGAPAHKHQKLSFSEALMRERARYQYTRAQVADAVGVAASVIKRWERGESVPSVNQFKRLAGMMRRLMPHAPAWGNLDRDAVLDGRFDETMRELGEQAMELERRDPTPRPPPEDFGAGLRRVREENEVTQDELGEILGLSGAAISQWERENTAPVQVNLDRLFTVLPEIAAGIATGAIRRPSSQDIPVPTGDRGQPKPRASTVDTMLEMALSQSDEQAASPGPIRARFRHHDFTAGDAGPTDVRPALSDSPHEHHWCDAPGGRARRRCAICGEPEPLPESKAEVRSHRDEHSVTVRHRGPCGGEVKVNEETPGAPWVCTKCLLKLWNDDVEMVSTAPPQPVDQVTQLAELYGRARLRVVLANRKLQEVNLMQVNAVTEHNEALKEAAEALELLDAAVAEEARR